MTIRAPNVARCVGRLTLVCAIAALPTGCLLVSTDYQVNYGLNHYAMGLDSLAIPPLLSAAESLEKADPPDRRLPQVLIALGNMATRDKRFDLAEDFYGRALKAAAALPLPDENILRNALVSGGMFYLGQNRAAEAAPLFERAAGISEQPPRFPRTLHAIDLDNLGQAYSQQGHHAEGVALSVRALRVLDEAPSGPDAIKTRGIILHNLGYSYAEQGRYAEAETHYRRALEILAPSAGPPVGETWRVQTVLTNYAVLLRKLGRNEEAKMLEARIQRSPSR
jgi:tetratricopeptide (TPR) repeat protein